MDEKLKAVAVVYEYSWTCPNCGEINRREGDPPMYGLDDVCDGCDEVVEVQE